MIAPIDSVSCFSSSRSESEGRLKPGVGVLQVKLPHPRYGVLEDLHMGVHHSAHRIGETVRHIAAEIDGRRREIARIEPLDEIVYLIRCGRGLGRRRHGLQGGRLQSHGRISR
ncbi:MAG: hypothetical protein V3S41_07930 [Spirochaetia bacterium]